VIALDGTKVRANAAMSANRAEDQLAGLAAAMVAAHGEADAAEDALHGPGRRGDRVPPRPRGGSAGGTRAERIARALAGLRAERSAAEAAARDKRRARAGAAAAGKPGRPPAGAEVELARGRVARAEAAHQATIAAWQARAAAALAGGARGQGLPGKPPLPASQSARVVRARQGLARAQARAAARTPGRAARRAKPAANITDPDSRLMPGAHGGFLQGYNAQNVTSSDGLIIAAELTASANDVAWFEPMVRHAEAAAELITRHKPPAAGDSPGPDGPAPGGARLIGLILADAGYLSEGNLAAAGPDRLIATGKHRNLEKAAKAAGTAGHDRGADRQPSQGSELIAAMTARLRTQEGITSYRQRGHIAETPHGYIKNVMGLRQLKLRGNEAAAAEWKFAAAVCNIAKAISSGRLTPATLAQLAT